MSNQIYSSRLNELLLYGITLVLTLCVVTNVLYSPDFSLLLPTLYEKDALFTGVGIKSIIDTGWVLTNPFLGAPAGYSLFDYPLSDSASFFIIKFVGYFSHQYAIVMNAFYFLTFPLVALISLFTLRRLGVDRIFAMVASILFTFLPYHLMRGENHLFLSAYYVVPFYVLLIVAVFDNESFSSSKKMLYAVGCMLAASSGIYYAFFACYFLMVAGLAGSLNCRTWQPCIKAFAWIALIMLTSLINIAPNLIFQKQMGKNQEVAQRHPSESESVGLKISQMVLPVDDHRIKVLRKLKEKYNQSAVLINENRTATLGLIGSTGFFILLGVLFIRRDSRLKDALFNLSCLTVSGVLLGTIGGLGALFAYTISPSIRSYNRISIFIGFFALCGFFIALQMLLKSRTAKRYGVYSFIIAGVLLLIGLYDQIGYGLRPNYNVIATQFAQDAAFVHTIEQQLPANAMIFQLPVTNFPENAVVYHMGDYELFKGYLHSQQLRWSYGAVKGRETFAWQKRISALPTKQMIEQLVAAGFVGLYINRQGYVDDAKQLERTLTTMLGNKPLKNENGRVIFYDLRGGGQA